MNDLTPPTANALSLRQPSPALKLQLSAAISNEQAVREIATNPRLRAECEQLYPTLSTQARNPSGTDGVMRVVGKRFALFGVNLTEESAPAWWDDYFEALEDIPESALEAGMRAHIKAGAQFMPKPGELRTLALTTVNPAVRALERARAALEYQPPKDYDHNPVEVSPRILRAEPTAEEKARARRWAADFSKRVEERPNPLKAPLGPPIQAKVDETGISAEMRALLARQRGEV